MKKVISVFGAVTLTASMFFPCTIVQAADVDTIDNCSVTGKISEKS